MNYPTKFSRSSLQVAIAAALGTLASPALLAQEQTCLIGGNTAQAVRGGALTAEWAYGVQYPGQVVAFGAAQVLGTGAAQHCPDCGRTLTVRYAV